MQRFINDNKNVFANQASLNHQDSVEKVLFRLKDLQEIQDQSRNELCPAMMDQESSLKPRRDSNYSTPQLPPQMNILKQLQEMQQKDKLATVECTISSKRGAYNQKNDNHLLQSNTKLKEDNIKLFSQCLKLRKMCQTYQDKIEELKKNNHFQQYYQRERDLEHQIAKLRVKLSDMSLVNSKLQEKAAKLASQTSSTSIILSKNDKMSTEIQLLSKQNQRLHKKVLNLEKQLEESSKCDSKSISINSTVQQSRKGDIQKDRMITNMKIVHESQVRRLKGIIQQLKIELGYKESTLGSVSNSKRR